MPVVPATQEAEAGESLESWEAEVAVRQDHTTTLKNKQTKSHLKETEFRKSELPINYS